MVERFKKHRDTHKVLTEDVIAEVKHLAGRNAALTSMCLDVITIDFPSFYKIKTENDILALISNGSLDFRLAFHNSRIFRGDVIQSLFVEHKTRLIEVLGKLIKEGKYKIVVHENNHKDNLVNQLNKLGICIIIVQNNNDKYLEFTCPLTAIYYQE